jgi:hypothetical protein
VRFLGTNEAYRLVRAGWIESRPAVIDGRTVAIWKATDIAKRALGFDEAEERRAG